MKTKFLKTVGRIRQRFEYSKSVGATERTIRENEEILNTLEQYSNHIEAELMCVKECETAQFLTLSALLEKFYRRGVMLQMHGYSQAAINWIDSANTDFLDSELQLRSAAGYRVQATFLDFVNIETSYRVIERFAQMDLKEIELVRKFKAQGSDQIVKNLTFNMESYLVKYVESGQTPTLQELIRYHAFNSERYGKLKG